MSDKDRYQYELDVIDSVAEKGGLAKFLAYAKISGPGWLQGAITLGGGSLGGALFLGLISGYSLLWVQPLAMICGVIMLSAIAYVTLSTGERPLRAINTHLHPLLGWSWLVATVMANIVWVMPQFALGTGAIEENFFGTTFSKTGTFSAIFVLFAIGLFVNFLYESGGKGAKLFDLIIKIMVGIIILCFFAVVITLITKGQVSFGQILSGFIPDPSQLTNVSPTFAQDVKNSSSPAFWEQEILSTQKSKIFTAFGTAVGINMTFLLPYTLLKKKWGFKHRGLSITDLSIGLFVPFFLATACVVIASASAFHGKGDDVKLETTYSTLAKHPQVAPAIEGLKKETEAEIKVWNNAVTKAVASLPEADRQLAKKLKARNQTALAITLKPAVGDFVAQKIFGVGVLGMALSTIIILMLINGLAFQEILSRSKSADTSDETLSNKKNFFIGCLISGLAGFLFPIIWEGDSKAAFVIPTSVIGGSLLPIAYFTFFLLMNSKNVLGDKRPEGKARLIWNILMLFATCVATFGSIWAIWGKDYHAGKIGTGFLVLLFIVGTLSFLKKEKAAQDA